MLQKVWLCLRSLRRHPLKFQSETVDTLRIQLLLNQTCKVNFGQTLKQNLLCRTNCIQVGLQFHLVL